MAAASTGDAPQDIDEECTLAELACTQAGAAGAWYLKVYSADLVKYSYQWQGKNVDAQKLLVQFMSRNQNSYCLGVARMQKKNEQELKTLQGTYKVGSTWKFT